MISRILCLCSAASFCVMLAACSSQSTGSKDARSASRRKQTPPASAPASAFRFPEVIEGVLPNGLGYSLIQRKGLPIVHMQLLVKSGAETDPKDLHGLSNLVALMLKEGTTHRDSARLLDDIEFLGADLWSGSDSENSEVGIQGLSDHFDTLTELLSDVVTSPAFDQKEFDRLLTREKDRLALEERDPRYLAERQIHRELYGKDHPYAWTDTELSTLRKVAVKDLRAWHKKYFAPQNASLVIVGDIDAQKAQQSLEKHFGDWKGKAVEAPRYPAPPASTARRVVIVDRPGSVQSIIYIGNLALKRNDPNWDALSVANQVLGGSAASRLFMDLREKRSLTYGAYSDVSEQIDLGSFQATAAVRTDVTAEAVAAFYENLDRIVRDSVPGTELQDAQRYLTDSLPLRINSGLRLIDLYTDLKIFDLPKNYWDNYHAQITAISSAQAQQAAQKFIQPDKSVLVVVGQAADFAEQLRSYGPVKVVDIRGKTIANFGQQAPTAAPSAKAKKSGKR